MSVVRRLQRERRPFEVVGCTSNIWYRAEPPEGGRVVVSTLKANGVTFLDDGTVECEAGTLISRLARQCVEKGWRGFEGLVDLPGTVAGAAVNNSGCYGCQTDRVLSSTLVLQPDGSLVTLGREDFGYSFRSSAFKRGERKGVIVKVWLKAEAMDDPVALKALAARNTAHRRKFQERPYGNLGSTYSGLRYKHTLKNKILYHSTRLAGRLLPYDLGCRCVKWALLLAYRRWGLRRFISDKSMQVFLWRESGADERFDEYVAFVEEVYERPQLEIEIR